MRVTQPCAVGPQASCTCTGGTRGPERRTAHRDAPVRTAGKPAAPGVSVALVTLKPFACAARATELRHVAWSLSVASDVFPAHTPSHACSLGSCSPLLRNLLRVLFC